MEVRSWRYFAQAHSRCRGESLSQPPAASTSRRLKGILSACEVLLVQVVVPFFFVLKYVPAKSQKARTASPTAKTLLSVLCCIMVFPQMGKRWGLQGEKERPQRPH